MRRHAFTLTDVMVSVFVLVVLLQLFVAVAAVANEADNRKRCTANLKSIGQALLLYANENKQVYPRATYDGATADKPTWGTPYEGASLGPSKDAETFAKPDAPGVALRPKPNDVTAALYLLMRNEDISPVTFVCPSTLKEAWDFGGQGHKAFEWTNWPGAAGIRDHLGYSFQNPYGSNHAMLTGFKMNTSLSAEFAVLADMNPGTDVLLKLTPQSGAMDMRQGNSLNHAREGQNVLYGDGHVQFASSPFAGVARDNIYTYGPSGNNQPAGGEGFIGSPGEKNDSILLPTANDVGLLDPQGNVNQAAVVKALSTQEAADLHKKIAGKYGRTEPTQPLRLEISDDKLVASGGPLTITYHYEFKGVSGEQVLLDLTAAEIPPENAKLVIEGSGVLISGNQFFSGHWKRE